MNDQTLKITIKNSLHWSPAANKSPRSRAAPWRQTREPADIGSAGAAGKSDRKAQISEPKIYRKFKNGPLEPRRSTGAAFLP